MSKELLTVALRYADAFADEKGAAQTPLPGVTILRQIDPTELVYTISKPLVALVLQGRKRVATGNETYEFGAGESLFIGADIPNKSQIISASMGKPYVSVVIDLDLAMIEQLMTEINANVGRNDPGICVGQTDAEVADVTMRLLRLLGRPAARSILSEQLLRELHYWLLVGRHGGTIQSLGLPDCRSHHIARAIQVLRSRYAEKIRVEDLAKTSGMSLSSFHDHFRMITSLTPLQFQKQLRLIEARRRLLTEGEAITSVAYTVGYESIPQFTREYSRFFGDPPGRDIKQSRARVSAA